MVDLRARGAVWAIAVLYCVVMAGLCVAIGSAGLFIALLPLIAVLMVRYSFVRLIIVVGGGVAVFGAGSSVSEPKVFFAALLVVCTVLSAWRLFSRPPAWLRYFKPLWLAIVVFLLAMGCSVIANLHLTDATTLARQSIYYVMVAAAPVIGLDAGRDLQPRVVRWLIVCFGSVGAIGFATNWLSLRGVSSLGVGRTVVSSLMLPAFGFAVSFLGLARARSLRTGLCWLVPTLLIPIALLVTGTRTNLTIFIAIPAVVGSYAVGRVPLGRVLAALVTIVGAGLVVFPVVAGLVVSQQNFLAERLEAALTVVRGSGQADESYSYRSQQYVEALRLFRSSPWLGLGPGFDPNQTLDTPLVTVVKLGVVGSAALLVVLGVALYCSHRWARQHEFRTIHAAVFAFAAVFIVAIPFGTPFEDRGFGLALTLAFAALGSEMQHPQAQQADTAGSAPDGLRMRAPRAVRATSERSGRSDRSPSARSGGVER